MYVMKCEVCGKEGARNLLLNWSPKTWKEKGPLPTSFKLCEKHSVEDALAKKQRIADHIERLENDYLQQE